MVGINGGAFMAGWGSDYADVGLLVSGCGGVVVFEGCLAGCNTTFVTSKFLKLEFGIFRLRRNRGPMIDSDQARLRLIVL
jgi:hypothetical protein